MFEDYLQNILQNTPKYTIKNKSQRESYCGIYKQDYPKWEGWKVIKEEKSKGVHISKIHSQKLNDLVYNFYYMKYIREKLL